jgi:hypothetical protein
VAKALAGLDGAPSFIILIAIAASSKWIGISSVAEPVRVTVTVSRSEVKATLVVSFLEATFVVNRLVTPSRSKCHAWGREDNIFSILKMAESLAWEENDIKRGLGIHTCAAS